MAAILDLRTFMSQILIDFLFIYYIQYDKKPLKNFFFFGGGRVIFIYLPAEFHFKKSEIITREILFSSIYFCCPNLIT